ncbi:MAG: hypothetical protein KJO51_07300 [Gramella sp.]|nr:hypothetical protein [Christiangramia sp.]
MQNFLEYLAIIWPLSPLFLFILAVSFRLMDNSAYLFLQREILISSSNVSRSIIKKEIRVARDPEFSKQLKRALIYRNLHYSFLISAMLSLPISILHFFLG